MFWEMESEYQVYLESSKNIGSNMSSLARHGLPDGTGMKENEKKKRHQRKQTKADANNPVEQLTPRHVSLISCYFHNREILFLGNLLQ